MKKNKKGFALIIAMGLVLIISLLAYTILEYMIPFSRSTRGIENSSKAYYQANSGIEEGLYDVYTRNGSGNIDNTDEYGTGFSSDRISKSYQTYSSGSLLPPDGEGNSEYDPDWNIITQGIPIQLEMGGGFFDSNFKIAFRVPDLNEDGIIGDETLSGTTLPMINWQLSSANDTLYASGEILTADDVFEASTNYDDLNPLDSFSDTGLLLWNSDGEGLDGNLQEFSLFYGANCSGVGDKCSLKFSIVNKLETESDNISIPYLEWKIDNDGTIIPLRYTKIEARGKANGYKKGLEVKVAGQTVNEAFDFTVFQ